MRWLRNVRLWGLVTMEAPTEGRKGTGRVSKETIQSFSKRGSGREGECPSR